MSPITFTSAALKRPAFLLAVLLAFLGSRAAFGDSFQFTVIPSNGTIAGAPGSTVGWGYSITNQSSADWLVTTNLAADSFLHGTPNLLFDFPNIAPGQTVTEAFDANTLVGLYKLKWDANAPPGFANDGLFILSAQWWDGDPTNGGNYIADSPDATAPYSAVVASNTIPEPKSSILFAFGMGTMLLAAGGKILRS